MKQFLQILIFLCVATVANAQNKEIEAMATFEMAEEQFNAKNYIQALEYVNKTKTILGKPTSRILFLGIQILNELSKTDAQYLEDALSAILVFEKIADAEQYIEEKRIEIAKVKLDLDKRKTAYEKEANRKASLKQPYEEMVYRLAAEFPKTETTVRDFIGSIPSDWSQLRYNYEKLTEKRLEKLIKSIIDDSDEEYRYVSYGIYPNDEQFYLKSIGKYKQGQDRIKKYRVFKRLKNFDRKDRKKTVEERTVNVEEICNVLNITKQQWNDFTTGADPLIRKDTTSPTGYYITGFKGFEKKPDGEYKYFQIFIHEKTSNWYTYEELWIQVFENTL